MGPGQRIRQLRKERGLKQIELAKRAGIAQASLSEIETGETKSLRGATLEGIARALQSNTRWIMSGRGQKDAEMVLSDEEEALLGLFDRLSSANKSAVLAAARALFRTQGEPAPPDRDDDHA